MTSFLLRRVAQMVVALLGASLLIFLLVRLTGDPANIMLPPDSDPSALAEFRRVNGLDQPLPVQYFIFLKNVVTGQLGTSIRYQEPVISLIGTRLSPTGQLAVTALGLSCVLGVVLGTVAARRRGEWPDRVVRGVVLIGQSVPSFYLGLLLILIFGVFLRVLPPSGTGTFEQLIMPAATLALYLLPAMVRVTRGAVLDVASQDYVRMARSKGIPEIQVLTRHILRNALRAPLTVLGLQLGAVVGAAVVVEVVFSWPGIGQLLLNGIRTRDFPVVQGVVVVTVFLYLVGSLLIDLAYEALDPRVRVR